ncbi:hypothetical protein U8527_19135 [Kordia algicida OT-1]|uniref:Uncharacterized protein n=1 Tax=Kordia algicida OT-1 TaxID=391587 RepID=A9DJK6_9FLAO|nr:hypothetical protein [Kordia algicida]EDP98122.1 hypothetical protein KAOT1_12932 [Kordia algicida OT-1]
MLNFFKGSKDVHKKTIAKLYISHDFSVYDLQSVLNSFFKTESQSDLTFKRISNGFSVDVNVETNEKKGIVTATRLQCIQNDHIIYVVAEHVEIDLSTYQEIKKPADFDLKKQAFFKHLQDHLLTLQNDHLYALKNEEDLSFVTSLEKDTQNFIFHVLNIREYILSILGVSEVTFNDSEKENPKNTSWFFVLTSERTFLVGKTPEDTMIFEPVSNEDFSILKKTGKDLITTENLSFYTEFMNDSLYTELLSVIKNTGNRLGIFGDIVVKKYHKKEAHLAFASRLFQLQSTTADLFINELKADMILDLRRLKVAEEQHESLLKTFKKHVNAHESFGENLITIVEDWQLSFIEQKKLLTVLQPLQKKETAKHTIAFHDHMYAKFIEKEKKKEVVFEFNLNYAKHLNNAERFTEAISLYRTIYETLPDDSIADLLPKKTTNLLEGEGGRQLKITILEAILYIQKQLDEDVSKTEHQLAELQPLVAKRIDALQSHKTYQDKAKTIQEVLHAKELTTATITHSNEYQRLEKAEVLKEVVPSCFKNAKGFFDSLNNFIAALNPPDYDSVISFSDRLNSHNYPEIMERITAICYALQINVPECYIGRGSYANSVIGVEGKPSFLMIGIDFLNPKHTRYLEVNALTFLIAIELAHMYFEHSKITSTDVWRGAADKGFTVVTMLLTVLPFVGNIGKIFGNVASVEKYGKIISRVEQVADVADKGQGFVEVSEKFNLNPFSKDKSQANDSENLLITSRLMEIVADKVALLFCNDLKAAVKGLLVGSNTYEQDSHIISQYGVEAFLARTNEEGEFVHQELIIRLKSMCAFYLSDTFEELKEQLYVS